MTHWLNELKQAKKTCIIQDNLKKVHFHFKNGREMVEEYNLDTNVVTRRAWKNKGQMGGEGEWDIEIGDPEYIPKENSLLIKENSSQPVVSRRNTRKNLEWRIRNLPYSQENYSVIADQEKKCIIVKTLNKKYYKILKIPELDRLQLLPEKHFIQYTHKFNTLIITYNKPNKLLLLEKQVLTEISKLQPSNYGSMDDSNCKPS